MGTACTVAGHLDFGISFTPLPLYSRDPFVKWLGGLQSRSGRYREIIIIDLIGTEIPTPRSPSQ
jgi:hypothetical protein